MSSEHRVRELQPVTPRLGLGVPEPTQVRVEVPLIERLVVERRVDMQDGDRELVVLQRDLTYKRSSENCHTKRSQAKRSDERSEAKRSQAKRSDAKRSQAKPSEAKHHRRDI